MAITRPIRSLLARGFIAAVVSGAAGCSIYPAAPAAPAFDTDVLPIFEAHCTRCHNNNPDGGPLHRTYRPDAAGGPLMALPLPLTTFGPCYSQDGGGATACSGAAGFHVQIQEYIHYTDPTTQMPPPPSRRLDDWEMNVIDSWTAQLPIPICSHSAHPDPALQCPP